MKKCLIVDDVEVTRFSTSYFLSEIGIESIAVGNITDAMKHLNGSKFDALFLDWHIGKDSGIELLKKIRIEFGNSMPVIVFSGVEKQSAAPEAIQAGANVFIEKPTTKEKLNGALKSIGLIS
jgi:DNA-binding NtrC family response regulator